MPSEELLDQIAGAVLDDAQIDWRAAESSADDAARPFLRHLRLVASVGQLHRRALPAPSAVSHDPIHWGPFRLIERIGHGTFGEVFRAWDTRLDREVALKLIPAAPSSSRGESPIIQEGRLLAKVRHPNVVTVYGAEQIGDRIGLWMEFVRGRTLEQLLNEGAAFPTEGVVNVGLELSRAVSAVHAAGLLHRDIKTHNVMRADDGRIVLMDFGTGTEFHEGASRADLAGTPLYLAPEVLAGGSATVQSDIYSIGVLLHRLVTNSYPVRGRSIQEVRHAHERGERSDVSHFRPQARFGLVRVIERACHPKTERRYQTAEALARDLLALQPRPMGARIRNTIGAVGALLVLVLLASETRARLGGSGRTGLATRLAAVLAGTPSPLDHPVIVVRPIKNLGNPDDNNLADLITDGVIRRLGFVEGLQVKGLETSFGLGDQPRDLAAVGRRLGVNLVLEGDLQFTQDSVVLHAALTSVTGQQLWSEPFERPIGSERDLSTLVDDLARAIVNRLRLKLGPTRMQYPTDLPTLRMYLEARAMRESRGARNLRAIELYNRVIAAYPDHAPALADLAATYGDLGAQYPTAGRNADASVSPERARALLWPLVQRALAIDDSVGEAHAAMGFFHALALQWDEAAASFEKAIDLEPTRSTLYGDYALNVLVPSGRLGDAITVLEEALRNDPESLDLRRILARVQLNAGRYHEALVNARVVLAKDKSFPFVELFAAWAQLFKGERVEALEWFETYSFGADGIDGTPDDLPGVRGWIHAINGRRAEAEAIAALPQFSRLPLRRVEIYGLLQDAEKTLEALEDQADVNPLRAAFYLTYPELSFLRDDPRLAEFRRRRLGLP
jgi:serine/threonine protein kinase/tetratricopeptide (TPR) repeat protein